MAYLTDDELLDTEDGFTEWDEDTAAGSTEETLEQALAGERLAELESELEQDEHPVDYDAELETEEEAAPVSAGWRKRPVPKVIFGWSWTNGTSWTGTGSAGSGTTKTSVGMCRWNTKQFRNQSSSPCG